MLVWIEKPTEKDSEVAKCGTKKFFCIRKGKFGVNLQAMCEVPPELDLPSASSNLHGRRRIQESPSATLPSDLPPELEPPPAEPPPD